MFTQQMDVLQATMAKTVTTDAHAKLSKEVEELRAAYASMDGRLKPLIHTVGVVGDSAAYFAADIDTRKVAFTKHTAGMDKHAKDLAGTQESYAHLASLLERILYLEQRCGDSADKHSQDMDALKAASARLPQKATAFPTDPTSGTSSSSWPALGTGSGRKSDIDTKTLVKSDIDTTTAIQRASEQGNLKDLLDVVLSFDPGEARRFFGAPQAEFVNDIRAAIKKPTARQ